MGWLWIIPAFHLPEPVRTDPSPANERVFTLCFPRSQLDFPLGPGSAVHHVLVKLEEITHPVSEGTATLMSKAEEEQVGI